MRLGEPEEYAPGAYEPDGGEPPPGGGDDGGHPWRRRLLLYACLSLAVVIGVVVLGATGWVWWVTRDLPSVKDLQNYAPPVTTRVYAGDGTLLGEYARERRVFVPISFVPKLEINAFTSAEDRNFYNHPGIDPGGMLRAVFKDIGKVIEGRRPEGAFTITQQVAKNCKLNADV